MGRSPPGHHRVIPVKQECLEFLRGRTRFRTELTYGVETTQSITTARMDPTTDRCTTSKGGFIKKSPRVNRNKLPRVVPGNLVPSDYLGWSRPWVAFHPRSERRAGGEEAYVRRTLRISGSDSWWCLSQTTYKLPRLLPY